MFGSLIHGLASAEIGVTRPFGRTRFPHAQPIGQPMGQRSAQSILGGTLVSPFSTSRNKAGFWYDRVLSSLLRIVPPGYTHSLFVSKAPSRSVVQATSDSLQAEENAYERNDAEQASNAAIVRERIDGMKLSKRQKRKLLNQICNQKNMPNIQIRNQSSRNVQDISVSHNDLQILIVSTTLLYRHLAMTRVSKKDFAIEIGSSEGDCVAALPCPALGVDLSSFVVNKAREKYPQCNFICGNIFDDNRSWLDPNATALFLDIGGGANYNMVMRALALCLPLLPSLRLIVAKSIEVWNFLRRYEDAVHVFAHDLTTCKDFEAEAAEELAIEIRRRGGVIPMKRVRLLYCGPRLRYLVGQYGMSGFLKRQATSFKLVEADYGPKELKLRLKVFPGTVPPRPHHISLAARDSLAKKVEQLLKHCEEWRFARVFGYLPRNFFSRYLAVMADPELHRQASDIVLDKRCPEPWSEVWENCVAMRHLYAFLVSTPQFVISGNITGDLPTISELCNLRIRWTGEPVSIDSSAANTDGCTKSHDKTGQRTRLEILDCIWHARGGSILEIQDLTVKKAWALVDGEVVEEIRANGTTLEMLGNKVSSLDLYMPRMR